MAKHSKYIFYILIGVNEWHAGISESRFVNIKRVYFVLPIIKMALNVLVCLLYEFSFMWISALAPLFSIVVIWLWSDFAHVSSCLNASSLIYLHSLFNYTLDTLHSYIDKVQVNKLNYSLQNMFHIILIVFSSKIHCLGHVTL